MQQRYTHIIRVFLLLLSATLWTGQDLYSQHLSKLFTSDGGKLELVLDRNYQLGANISLIGEVTSASLDGNGKLAVAARGAQGIILFDLQGTQLRTIGKAGRGPGELVEPGIIKLKGNQLYVWDRRQLKFLMFDVNSAEPLVEIRDFRWAAQDFEIYGSDIFFYNSGRLTGPYIEQYDMDENQYVQNFGQRTQEHTLLMSMREAGGIFGNGNYIYFISPSSLALNRMNMQTFQVVARSIKDEDFYVPEVDSAALIIPNRRKFFDFIHESSRVINLLVVKDYIIVEGIIGEDTFVEKNGQYGAQERKVRLYILNTDMQLIDTFTFALAAGRDVQHKIWGSNRKQLFFLSTYNLFGEEDHDSPGMSSYYMHLWNLERSKNN